jgi:predicted RNase H-like HicB family nuclease
LIMAKVISTKTSFHGRKLPVIVQKGEDGFYVVECPILDGCYTQGKTIDEALKNVREVIELVLEEKEARYALREFNPVEVSLHTIAI